MRILVIEDNPKISQGLRTGLEAAGFVVDTSLTGIEGEERAAAGKFDAVILDVMLPDGDGVEICRNLRRRHVATPIILLTALDSLHENVLGLDAGADDYLSKPFKFEELVARIHAVVRRGHATGGKVLRADDLELDLYTRRARRGEETWELSNREFKLLEYLMHNQNRVLTRTQIGERVWDMNFESSSNVIDVYISALRRKFDVPGGRALFHTIKNAGYRFGILD